MTIRQLEYFCAVAEGRSISAAARALHVADKEAERILQAQAVRTDAARVPAERKCILRQRLNSRFL